MHKKYGVRIPLFCFPFVLLVSLVTAQYEGAPATQSATPSNLPMTTGPSAPAVAPSATPNSVNTQFPQNNQGMPGVTGANGQPMPLLNPYQPLQQQKRTFNGPVQYGQHTPSTAPEKPFSNYTPKPFISPYMNLFRRDRMPGIDNYNMYVKPALEQEQMRVQTSTQISELQQNQNQTRVQEQVQFNANVGASTVGASYGQMNTGTNTNQPGASFGFAGTGPTVHTDPNAAEKEESQKKGESQEEEEKTPGTYFNPYTPQGEGVMRPHYEPAKRK